MRRVRRWALRLIVGVGGLLLWTVALWGSGLLVEDVTAPEEACYQEEAPWFEPTEVERARVSAWPPLVRCALVDPRYPTRTAGLWHGGDLALLAGVDVAAVVLAVAVLLRWWRGRIDLGGSSAE
jgi:hypothetical protein